jgi:hypothetical protein
MGTSTSYSAPPAWGDLKSDVTRGAGAGTLSRQKARELVSSFIQHNGGASAIARGGAGGKGGSVARGRAARAIANRVGGFISDVGRVGLEQALRNAGWDDLIGRPIAEVLPSLLDRLGGSASTIDDVDARMALSRLQEKYFGMADSAAELEQLLSSRVDQLDTILHEFFSYYLFEVFCRVFFERLVTRVGETRANSFLEQIGQFISSTLTNRTDGQKIGSINWSGPQGEAITADIMEATLRVFGG